MIPAPFDYYRAGSVDEAIDLLGSLGEDAKLLAGGHSLLPLMKLRLARPSYLVDIGRIRSLSYVKLEGDRVAVGALTRYHDLEHSAVLRQHCGILAHATSLVGDPQVRNRGTIGGSVAHGDPASDLPSVLAALDAEFVCVGPDGTRVVPAADFFTDLFETLLLDTEVLTEIRVPVLSPQDGWSYLKFNRRAQDWAIVGVAAVVGHSEETIHEARIGLTNMGSRPIRARVAERALSGASVGAIAAAADMVAEDTSPPADSNGSVEYRQHLARVLTRRALEQAIAR